MQAGPVLLQEVAKDAPTFKRLDQLNLNRAQFAEARAHTPLGGLSQIVALGFEARDRPIHDAKWSNSQQRLELLRRGLNVSHYDPDLVQVAQAQGKPVNSHHGFASFKRSRDPRLSPVLLAWRNYWK